MFYNVRLKCNFWLTGVLIPTFCTANTFYEIFAHSEITSLLVRAV